MYFGREVPPDAIRRDKMLNNNEQRWILVYLPKLIYLHLNFNHFIPDFTSSFGWDLL